MAKREWRNGWEAWIGTEGWHRPGKFHGTWYTGRTAISFFYLLWRSLKNIKCEWKLSRSWSQDCRVQALICLDWEPREIKEKQDSLETASQSLWNQGTKWSEGPDNKSCKSGWSLSWTIMVDWEFKLHISMTEWYVRACTGEHFLWELLRQSFLFQQIFPIWE